MDIIADIRRCATLGEHEIANVHSTDFPRTYVGFDDAWSFERFKQRFRVDVASMDSSEMVFDVVGVDAAVANAIRRILLAEVPTMAIEKVFVHNNTSVIQDEVLAHRLGLIPLDADARLFEFPPNNAASDEQEPCAENTLVFDMKVRCRKLPDAAADAHNPDQLYADHKVFSSALRWCPLGNQRDLLMARPVHDDILIAKLRPGHEIDVVLHAVKGVGRDHAKFSPVATASYRLLPEIRLLRRVTGTDADDLQACFSDGVVDIVQAADGQREAEVVNARKDACSREVLRHDHLKDAVKLSKVRDHFIFSVESAVAQPPQVLVCEAIKILMSKCRVLLQEIEQAQQKMDTG